MIFVVGIVSSKYYLVETEDDGKHVGHKAKDYQISEKNDIFDYDLHGDPTHGGKRVGGVKKVTTKHDGKRVATVKKPWDYQDCGIVDCGKGDGKRVGGSKKVTTKHDGKHVATVKKTMGLSR